MNSHILWLLRDLAWPHQQPQPAPPTPACGYISTDTKPYSASWPPPPQARTGSAHRPTSRSAGVPAPSAPSASSCAKPPTPISSSPSSSTRSSPYAS
eukprot:1898802-Prymnesium_polylepis.1